MNIKSTSGAAPILSIVTVLISCIALVLSFVAVLAFAQDWYEAEEASSLSAYDYHGAAHSGGAEISGGASYTPEYSDAALNEAVTERTIAAGEVQTVSTTETAAVVEEEEEGVGGLFGKGRGRRGRRGRR